MDTFFVDGLDTRVERKDLKRVISILVKIALFMFKNREDLKKELKFFVEKYIELACKIGTEYAPISLLV